MSPKDICDHLRPRVAALPSGTSYAIVKPATSNAPDPRDRELVLPMLLVHPETELGGQPKGLAGYTRQPRMERYAFVTICQLADLEALRELLDSSLLGQQLPGYEHITSFVEGQTQALDASVIWWKDVYQTQRDRRHTS